MSALDWIKLGAALWLAASIVLALIFGRVVSHADRDSNREQAQREPVAEGPSKIFVISNHGELSK